MEHYDSDGIQGPGPESLAFWKSVKEDQKAIWLSSVTSARRLEPLWLLFAAGTAALILTDKRIESAIDGRQREEIAISKWASRLAGPQSIGTLVTGAYAAAKWRGHCCTAMMGRLAIRALANAEITANLLKAATQRSRPKEKDYRGDSGLAATVFRRGIA